MSEDGHNYTFYGWPEMPWKEKQIPLSQGASALVSAADYDRVSRYRWYLAEREFGTYAIATIRGREIYMHRFILDCPEGMDVHHKDKNGLNNKRDNICIATRQQNIWASTDTRRKNQYIGVWKVGNRWRSKFRHNYEQCHIGYFDTAEEAARAYDKEVTKRRGEFAITNKSMGLL